ncbi:hypothetical protein [Pantoea septica]|uniref:hypothetical protein n=1 Tax=Pantoea septica TaxID=472695 RepID=UPI0005357F18|nr:hypothetical protein [Pantoea septica]
MQKGQTLSGLFYGCELNVEHYKGARHSKRGKHGPKSKASRAMDKNAGSIFEQRSALARLRAHLMDEVRIRAGRASMDAMDFAIGPCLPRQHLAVLRF